VNLKVPRRWETLNNKMLAASVKSYPNAVLVAGAASAATGRNYFGRRLHLRRKVAKVYASLLAQASVHVNQTLLASRTASLPAGRAPAMRSRRAGRQKPKSGNFTQRFQHEFLRQAEDAAG